MYFQQEESWRGSCLLLDHVNDTFVTPVFNGSTSLRDASGHLIESTVKSVRRDQTVDDAYMEKLYSDTISLYHLDQPGKEEEAKTGGKADLGALPPTAVALLTVLVLAWVLIILYVVFYTLRRKQKERNRQ